MSDIENTLKAKIRSARIALNLAMEEAADAGFEVEITEVSRTAIGRTTKSVYLNINLKKVIET